MSNEIFRKKSVDKMKSPENLSEYIKVINPSICIVFVAVLLLLAGAFVWASVGRVEDKLAITAVVKNGTVVCEYDNSVKTGMKAVIGNSEGTVGSVSESGITINFKNGIQDGVYSGYIVLGQISPISFVFN